SNGIDKRLHSSQDKTIKKDFSKFKKSEPTKKFDKSRKCYRCDSTQHLAHECKHKNTQCRNCLKNWHLAKVCRSKRNETVKQIECCSETVPVNSVKSPRHARDKILLEIFVEGDKCLFELDTGAAISCMNVNEFKKLCPDVSIKPTKLLLRNFDNSMITSAGQAMVQIQYKDQINTETIYLVHAKVNAVFGREWLRTFQLDWSSIKAVRVENCNSRTNKLNILLQKYEKIFSPGIGKNLVPSSNETKLQTGIF
ncbi:transposon Tf2-9 polyprotein, partial [Trichonephila clavipes]